jgi:Holliday junction DNA helicase RuvB
MPGAKTGDRLFEGTTYPRNWDEYVGQKLAVEHIKGSCVAAKIRGERLGHVLIASGAHGIGKTAVAKLIAQEMGVGLLEVQGAMNLREGLRVFASMADGDILFWDEIHLAVVGGKSRAEWLLPVMTEGHIVTPTGAVMIPDVTIIGATTDAQKLPQTMLSRFLINPVLVPYTDAQAQAIAKVSAGKIFTHPSLDLPNDWVLRVIARAANNNPRAIAKLLSTLRDSALAGLCLRTPNGGYSLDTMFRWAGVTADGLDTLAQDYLIVLSTQLNGKAGKDAIASALGEPTLPRYTEQLLKDKGFLTGTSSGQELTGEGAARALQLTLARIAQEEEK